VKILAANFNRLSPFLALLGGTILLITGLVGSQTIYYDTSPWDIVYIFRYINAGVTAIWAGLAIYGAVLAIRGKEQGRQYMLLAGIGGIIGTFIPIYAWEIWEGYTRTIKLNSSAMFIDVVLILIGGILGYALMQREPPKE
jgi:hypothetical protein